MKLNEYADKKVVVMGLGIHGGGLGVAQFFARHGAGVTVTDLKSARELAPSMQKLRRFRNISYILGKHRMRDFASADIVIQNPGVGRDSPYLTAARSHGARIENEASIFFRHCPNPIVGVTGTKGKSTTTNLIARVLKTTYRVHVGGNIGISMLSLLPKLKKGDVVLLELSSWQLEGLPTVKKSPHIAVLTNIENDHQNTYPSFKHYAEAKKNIFRYQKKGDALIIHSLFKRFAQGVRGRIITYTYDPRMERMLRKAGFSLAGKHAIENAQAAVLAGTALGIPLKKAVAALGAAKPLFGRFEKIREHKGVSWINDTCSTAPYSTIQSITTLPKKKIILIAGGTDKKLDMNDLAKTIDARVKKLVLLSGSATEKLKKCLTIPYIETALLKDAVRAARAYAAKGDTVLFSPGAASFELFKNEFDRGKKFVRAVKTV